MTHLSAETREGGTDGIVSALFGLPTAEPTLTPQTVTSRMAAISNANSGFDHRLHALETRVQMGEVQLAEVQNSVSSIKAEMEEMKKEIQLGFGSLRSDLMAYTQPQSTNPK